MSDARQRRNGLLIYGLAALVLLAAGIIYWQRSTPQTRAVAVSPPPPPAPAAPEGRLTVTADAAGGPEVKTVLDVPRGMRYGQSHWDEKGVPEGPVWVRVDLDAQVLSVFRGGHEIGTAVILHGADKKPTPTGQFPILAKLKDHKSSIYDAPMPYTLRLTGDGISVHGSDVRYGLASNGCIGIPKNFAAQLFGAVKTGDQVVIVKGA